MLITKIKSKEEILDCVNLYYNLNDHSFIEIDKKECIKNLTKIILDKEFVRILKHNDKIIAWLWARKVQALHSIIPMFQQMYYACSEKGFLAYKSVVLLHEAMIEEAKRQRISFAISQGSHMDPDNTYVRILERNGWERRGHVAIYRIAQDPIQRSTFLSR